MDPSGAVWKETNSRSCLESKNRHLVTHPTPRFWMLYCRFFETFSTSEIWTKKHNKTFWIGPTRPPLPLPADVMCEKPLRFFISGQFQIRLD